MIALQTLAEQEAIYMLIASYQAAVAVAIVASIACLAIGVSWLVYEKWFTPDESKEIRKAFRKKRPLLILGGDDGHASLRYADRSGPEGVISTRNEGRTQEHFTGALPRPSEMSLTDLANLGIKMETPKQQKAAERTLAVANQLSAIANRKLILQGARIPVWFAYRGKAIITSLYWLAGLAILEGLIEEAKKGVKGMEAFATIDIVAIKSLFPMRQWNQSQINAQEADRERTGELKAKKFAGKESLIMMFAIMIILVVVVIALIAAVYFFTH